MVKIYVANTERTSTPILLNSSKQLHAPLDDIPLKKLDIASTFNPSEQLKTRH